MLRKSLPLIAALGLVGASAPIAQADLCFHYGSGGGTLVARGAKLPAPGECVTLAMFEKRDFPGSLAGAATGSICMGLQNTTVIYHYTYDGCIGQGGFSYFESATCRLRLEDNREPPSRFGGCRGKVSGFGDNLMGNFNDDTLELSSCDEPFDGLDAEALCVSGEGLRHQPEQR